VLGVHLDDLAVALRKHHDAGIHGALVLDAGGDDGGLGGHKRHGLALHVCAHQGAVSVVVFQERDHGRGYGDHHAGAYIHVIHALAVDLDDLVAVAAGYTLVEQAAVFVHRLGGLGHDELVLHVGGQVIHLVVTGRCPSPPCGRGL
jgi:hypothetical protein